MAIPQSIIILMMFMVSCTLSLVAWIKYPNITSACDLPDGRKMDHLQVIHHPDICGNYVCWDKDGTTALHYCQSPLPFQECKETGVNTARNFPECCWQCVKYTKC